MPSAGKILTESLESIAKQAPKRTEFKALSEIPEEVKALEPEARATEAAKILDEPKIDEFIGVRQTDIKREQAYAEGKKTDLAAKQEQARQEIESLKAKEAEPVWNREQFEAQQASVDDLKARQDALEKLNERQRDLYLKASDLKIENTLTKQIQVMKEKGQNVRDSVYDVLADRPGAGGLFSSVEGRNNAIYNRLNSKLYELKEALRTKNLGFSQNKEMMDETLRYLKDGKVKNQKLLKEVKQIADQWKEVAEKIKALRNKAGGRVRELEDWIMPQSHDKRKLRLAGYKNWQKNIIDKLDRQRIESEQGGPLEDVLEAAYKNIISPKVETTTSRGGSVVAKRHEASRVLHFKSADDMIAYNKDFGNPDIFATMDSHIRTQSNEIALMQIMGSNPEAMFNKLKELARADGMGQNAEAILNAQWRQSSGLADGDNIVSNADATLAAVAGGFRSAKISAQLGSAMISSLADLGNIFLGANYRGLSSINIFGRGLTTLLQEATTIGKVGKNIELANRIGVVSEFANASLSNSRFAESTGAGFFQKSAEVVIRASGLGSYTTSLRASFGLELAANLAENFGKKLDDVEFSEMIKEYGITAKQWDIIRSTKPKDIKGAKFIDMDDLYAKDEQLGYRVSEMITNEMNSFVVMPGDRARKYTTAGMAKGTMGGEATRLITMFKSFPISLTMMHLNRIGKIQSTTGKVAYAGKAIAASTVMGGITLWAYDIATGKTPRSYDRPAFVLESIAKGGGFGIFGDFFIGMSETQYGTKFSSVLLGMPASELDSIVELAQGAVTKDADKSVSAAYNLAKGYIPGQNLWYTRATIERTIGDTMNEFIDPDYHKRIRRRDKALNLRDQELLFK